MNSSESFNKFTGWAEVVLAGICFGFLGIFARYAYANDLAIGELLTWRFTMAACGLWIYALIFNRRLLMIGRRQIFISALLGLLGYAVFSSFYFEAIKGVSVALAVMLLFTFPVFVNLGAHFILKHRLKRHQWWALILSLTGLLALLWGDITVQSPIAVLCGLASAISYAIYVLVSGVYQQNVRPLSSSLYVITFAAVGLALYHQPSAERIFYFNQWQWLILVGIGTICTIAPLTLFLIGLQKMPSSQASLVVMVEPITATLAAWLILGERLEPQQIIGSALILSGMFLSAKVN